MYCTHTKKNYSLKRRHGNLEIQQIKEKKYVDFNLHVGQNNRCATSDGPI